MPWYITEEQLPPKEVELIFFYPDGHREKKEFAEEEVFIGNGKYKLETMPTHWCHPEAGDLKNPQLTKRQMMERNIKTIDEKVEPKERIMENTRQRTQITEQQIDAEFEKIKRAMKFRLEQKGYGTFASIHEISGVITEEYDEMKDAVRENDPPQVRKELIDIAVGAIFGSACIINRTIDW